MIYNYILYSYYGHQLCLMLFFNLSSLSAFLDPPDLMFEKCKFYKIVYYEYQSGDSFDVLSMLH